MNDKPKGVGQAIKGFGSAMLKLINIKKISKVPD